MRNYFLSVLVALSSLFIIALAPASASTITTTYTYAGSPFDHFSGTDACPPECGMTGYFVIAGPPPQNLSGPDAQYQFDVTPLTYAFSDGLVTATPANSNFDFFSIQASGTQVSSWDIRLFTPSWAPCSGCVFTGTQLLINSGIDISIIAPAAVDFAASLPSQGTWVVTTNAIPEPSTWAMVIMGLAGVGLMAYRKSKRTLMAA